MVLFMFVPSLCLAQEEQRSQEQIVEEALAEFTREFMKQAVDYCPRCQALWLTRRR